MSALTWISVYRTFEIVSRASLSSTVGAAEVVDSIGFKTPGPIVKTGWGATGWGCTTPLVPCNMPGTWVISLTELTEVDSRLSADAALVDSSGWFSSGIEMWRRTWVMPWRMVKLTAHVLTSPIVYTLPSDGSINTILALTGSWI